MLYRTLALAAAAGVVLAAAPAWADDDDDDHRGRGHGHGHKKHKEEYWDGNCKVERKWKHGEYEEKRKCRAPETVYVVPAQPAPQRVVVVYPPWIVQQRGEYVYAPPQQPRHVRTASYCNSDTVGRVLGGIVGGALGNQIGKGNGRTAATIGGAVAGVLIGGEIGKRMDAADQGCVGQVLEVAPVDRRVQWAEGPAQYVVVPGRVVERQGAYCRPYTVEVKMDGYRERSKGMACRRHDGVWVAA